MLSDAQMMLLEQLTYLNDNIYSQKLKEKKTIEKVADIVQDIDVQALKAKPGMDSSYIQYAEWGATIEAIKNDPELMNLKVIDSLHNNKGNTIATCFEDKEGRAVVAFRGTSNAAEWQDNAEGFYLSDTELQKEALGFIEDLPYDSIDVVGHSKGGNKAMYVTILSDKVSRCVSMDGQGFSKEFTEKYWAEIEQRGGKIKSYSLSDDYVNILLYPIPNSQQFYCQGFNGNENHGADNHSPNSYFEYKNGKLLLTIDSNIQGPKVEIIENQNEGMKYLHEFSNFLNNSTTNKERKMIGSLAGIALSVSLTNEEVNVNGEIITKDNLSEYLMEHPEEVGLIIGYLAKYVDVYNISTQEVTALVDAFGVNKVLETMATTSRCVRMPWTTILEYNSIISSWEGSNITSSALDYVDDRYEEVITDLAAKLISEIPKWANEIPPWAYYVPELISIILEGNANMNPGLVSNFIKNKWNEGVEVIDPYEMILQKSVEVYRNIPAFDKEVAIQDLVLKTGEIRDFSIITYNSLIESIRKFNSNPIEGVSVWNSYNIAEWFEKLFVNCAISAVNKYRENLETVSIECKNQILTIYENVEEKDTNNANRFESNIEGLESAKKVLISIRNGIHQHGIQSYS